jgi:hypothetical protein
MTMTSPSWLLTQSGKKPYPSSNKVPHLQNLVTEFSKISIQNKHIANDSVMVGVQVNINFLYH